MCGIFFSLCRDHPASPDTVTARLLGNRGPDSFGTRQVSLEAAKDNDVAYRATFVSTVLSLRGTTITEQPLFDESSQSVFCWNGEAWKYSGQPISGSDSRLVFQNLLDACATTSSRERELTQRRVTSVLSSIGGPYAFVFFDAKNRYLYYGRDCLGRRSLLQKSSSNDGLILSSVCDNSVGDNWSEIKADGIYVVDLSCLADQGPLDPVHIPHCRQCLHADQIHFVGRSIRLERVLRPPECSVPPNEHDNTSIRSWYSSKLARCRPTESVT